MNREIFRDNSIGLLILAGGKSERMGSDKAGLILGELTFSQTLAENMGLYSERLFSSAKGPAPCGFSLIADSQKLTGKGQMAGIATALSVCESRALMVVPCDCPFADFSVAEKATGVFLSLDDTGCVPVIASGDNGVEPLIGVYPRNAGPIIEKLLLMGKYRARDILEATGYRTVKIKQDKLININTPEDYIKYGKRR